jgi:hypothetical protein
MPCKSAMVAALTFLLLDSHPAMVTAAEPTASAPLESSGGRPTTFRVKGSIDHVNKGQAVITLFADAPFWGPPRFGGGEVVQWPKDTLFVLFVPALIPMTIDGKRASFAQLAVGQKIDVQYNISSSGTGCVAYRIDAHSPHDAFASDGQAHPLKLVGHWRYVGSGGTSDYWFSHDGSFKVEVVPAGRSVRHSSGKWWVAGDTLYYGVTESSDPGYPAGKKDHDKILALTKDYYVVENLRRDQDRFVRIKP